MPPMPPLPALLAHLAWADARAHAAIATLAVDRPERREAERLYAHLAAAAHVWLARLEGREAEHPVWPDLSLDAARALADASLAGLRAVAERAAESPGAGGDAFARVVAYRTSAGQPYRSTVDDVLTHVALHGSHHRGQIAALVRAGDGAPAPTDYIVFAREALAGQAEAAAGAATTGADSTAAAIIAATAAAIPTLETPRLRLRPFTAADVAPYTAMMADPEVTRFLGDGRPLGPADAWRQLATFAGHWMLHGFGLWAVEERATGAFVGRIGCLEPEGWPAFEVAYTLARSAWGRGLAREGAAAALAHARTVLGRREIVSIIRPGNVGSIRVATALGARPAETIEFFGGPAVLYRYPAPPTADAS